MVRTYIGPGRLAAMDRWLPSTAVSLDKLQCYGRLPTLTASNFPKMGACVDALSLLALPVITCVCVRACLSLI